MRKPSIKKQKKKKKTDWWDGIWLQDSILKQLNFLRRIIFLYLGVTGLLSRFINKYQKKDERYSFIELGCGGSSYLPYLAKKYNNLQLFGMDKSLMGCKLAVIGIDDGLSKIQVVQGDVLQCPLKSKKFDIVFSLGLIEHFDEPDKILKKHVNLLKPGGLLICVVPNVFGIQGKFLGLKLWYPKDLPSKYLKGWIWGMRCISIKNLENWLVDLGLNDITVKPIGGIYPFLIMESYRPDNLPLSFKLFYFIYRYLLFLPSIVINIPFIFRLNSQSFSPFFIAVGIKNSKQ
jgi:SAM-dependent methyltransferase